MTASTAYGRTRSMAHCSIPCIPLREQRAFTVGETAALMRLSIATLYKEMRRGRLKTIKRAGRRLILHEDLEAYLAAAGQQSPTEPSSPAPMPISSRNRNVRRPEGVSS